MKLTLEEILSSINAFSKLTSANLSLKVAYPLRKMVDILSKETDFFWEQRRKIKEKYLPDSERTAEDTQKLENELTELLSWEVDIDCDRISISSTEDVKLSIIDMKSLEKFIEFVE